MLSSLPHIRTLIHKHTHTHTHSTHTHTAYTHTAHTHTYTDNTHETHTHTKHTHTYIHNTHTHTHALFLMMFHWLVKISSVISVFRRGVTSSLFWEVTQL